MEVNLEPWMLTAAIVAVIGATAGPFLIRSARAWRVRAKLLLTGADAMATLIRTWDTGVRINDAPQVGMLVEVQPPGGAPFRAEVTGTIPIVHLSMVQPGARLHVRYDPAVPGEVALVSVIGTAATPDGPPAISLVNRREAERILEQRQAAHLEILRTGTPAPAKVLEYAPSGITVNGDNPAVSLFVEVQPPGSRSFTAYVFGIPIVEASIPRYQPGRMVRVRYDPGNLTRVAVERSGD